MHVCDTPNCLIEIIKTSFASKHRGKLSAIEFIFYLLHTRDFKPLNAFIISTHLQSDHPSICVYNKVLSN